MVKEDLADAFDDVFDQSEHVDADDGRPARARWHVELGGEEVGPLSLAEIGRHVEAGRVDPTTRVWRKGMSDWASAGDVAEIDALFIAPPIPAPRSTSIALAALVDAELSRAAPPAPAAAAADDDDEPPPSALPGPRASPASPSIAAPEPLAPAAPLIPEPLAYATPSLIPEPLAYAALPNAAPPALPAPHVVASRTALYAVLAVAGAGVVAALVAAIVVVAAQPRAAAPVWRDGVAWAQDPSGAWHALPLVGPASHVEPASTNTASATNAKTPATSATNAKVPITNATNAKAPATNATTSKAPATNATNATNPKAPASTTRATAPASERQPAASETRTTSAATTSPAQTESEHARRPVSADCADLGIGCDEDEAPAKAKAPEGLPPSAVLAVARDHLSQIRACGAKYGGTGLARVGWKVEPSGRVVDVKLHDGRLQGTQLGACITNTIASWSFPEASGPTKVSTLPLPLQ